VEIMLAVLVFVLLLFVLGWLLEVRTPPRVQWREVDHQGMAAHVAPGLVLSTTTATPSGRRSATRSIAATSAEAFVASCASDHPSESRGADTCAA
jgi:hypothetical protein